MSIERCDAVRDNWSTRLNKQHLANFATLSARAVAPSDAMAAPPDRPPSRGACISSASSSGAMAALSSGGAMAALSSAGSAAASYAWEGPQWLSRLAGQEPHQAPQPTEQHMKKVLGLFGLTCMSTAAIIGSGIFVLTGVVAKNYAGPAVALSYVIAGVVAGLSAMCYMEFAAETKTTGASVVYTCRIFGKFVAWLVAINVLLELVIASAAVATGFSAYLASLIKSLDEAAHPQLSSWDGSLLLHSPGANGSTLTLDLVAAGAVLLVAALLVAGVRQAEWLASACTGLCLLTIAMSIVVGFVNLHASNLTPFAPFGPAGVFRGASVVFFAYLGFEMMAAAPEEAVNARRDVPLGIGLSVAGCTVLYVLMALVIAGMQPYQQIDASAPFASAFRAQGATWMAIVVSFGSLFGIADTIVVVQYSMSRTFVMLGRMGLVPPMLSRVHPKTQTPVTSVLFCGAVSAVLALLVPIGELADLTSLGALFAFCCVSAGVIFRRYYQPPSVPAGTPGMRQGVQGAPLWHVLAVLWSIIGSSLGLSFAYAAGNHWGVYVAMAGWWLASTSYAWLRLPVVFVPVALRTPLFPFWPSAGVLTTIFMIATLGPTNWARWGFACAVGASLYLLYGAGDAIYTRMHGPAPRGATLDALPGSRATAAKRCKDVEAGGGDDVADVSEGEAGVTVTTAAVSGRAGKDAAALAGSNVC